MSPFKRPGSAPGSFHASFEVLPGNGPADEPSGAAAGEAPRVAYAVRADPMLLEAVRQMMPELLALPSGDDTPSAGAGGGAGGAAFARLSPAASAVLADAAAAAAAAASETAITLETATHVMYGGCLYPLLWNADGEPIILAPNYTNLGHLHYYAAPRASVSGQVATGKAWPSPVCQTLAKLPVDRYYEVYLA
ncbi:hypothetical protein MNEG_8406 [Monoraphidium neglectum]|uniref:Uncharacterized protein n=1 Tax=Monoraphidium neglectum TaxID=145388 RepID=A0A0D2KW27_9CHLO|nr:hypothetical protein MNEG_8406 [Monoraphidium neglectum]KIY99558.1 hypothetical protein MNEG_8406 [Monoraphidium neglectum]|eukprot:XP_013898578.1 hypothetical protein MNEG_8406 [Monoraphidium neglectum]